MAVDGAKNVIFMSAHLPVERAVLGCTFDSTRGGLVDVDMGDGCIVSVLFDGEVDAGDADGFTLPPANALEGENCVGIIGEGFVLGEGEVS